MNDYKRLISVSQVEPVYNKRGKIVRWKLTIKYETTKYNLAPYAPVDSEYRITETKEYEFMDLFGWGYNRVSVKYDTGAEKEFIFKNKCFLAEPMARANRFRNNMLKIVEINNLRPFDVRGVHELNYKNAFIGYEVPVVYQGNYLLKSNNDLFVQRMKNYGNVLSLEYSPKDNRTTVRYIFTANNETGICVEDAYYAAQLFFSSMFGRINRNENTK